MAVAKSNLAIEKDKLGVDVEINYCQMLGGTQNLVFFLTQYTKLIQNGHAHPQMVGSNRSKAVYATIDSRIVGQITFEILDDYSKTTWITLSAVDEEFRGRGIYSLLHKHLEALMLELGSRKLASQVHVDNTGRQASAKKAGMKPVYYRMEKDI